MAVSKIQNGFQMIYESDWTKFATPEAGVYFNTFAIRQVEKNLYYVFIDIRLNNSTLAANSTMTAGTLDLSYFGNKPITAVINGNCSVSGKDYPCSVQISVNGEIRLMNHGSVAGNAFTGNGFVVRREV